MDLISPDLGLALWSIFLLLAFLIPLVLFLLTQQNTLKLIRPENRFLRPVTVWRQLVPLYNLYWQFVVVTRIADSIEKEKISSEVDSILELQDSAPADAIGKRPTYGIGMAWCSLLLVEAMLILLMEYFPLLITIQGLVAWATMICWIIYWVKLADQKRKIKRSSLIADIG